MKSGKKILIVDDDEIIAKSLLEILELAGYCVDIAYTGKEAIRKSEANDYNLAILDIKLPDMEGTELLKAIHDGIPKMAKIMVTGYPELDNAVKSLNMGATAYLMKPVTPKKLLETVKEKIAIQEEDEEMNQEKVKDWIETRVRKLKHGDG